MEEEEGRTVQVAAGNTALAVEDSHGVGADLDSPVAEDAQDSFGVEPAVVAHTGHKVGSRLAGAQAEAGAQVAGARAEAGT